jgi:hypothetical protein
MMPQPAPIEYLTFDQFIDLKRVETIELSDLQHDLRINIVICRVCSSWEDRQHCETCNVIGIPDPRGGAMMIVRTKFLPKPKDEINDKAETKTT